MTAIRSTIQRYWREMACVTRGMPFDAIARAADLLLDCQRRGGTVFAVGNGGSASTASHFACDLAKNTRVEGLPFFRVVPLTDNMALMTAWANDTSYKQVYAEQLKALLRPGDVLVVISASGNSPNVLRAAETARKAGACIVALTGRSGGRLAPMATVAVRVPADPIEQVEDAHVIVAHSLCVAIRDRLRQQSAGVAADGWASHDEHDDQVIDFIASAGDA
jgi:D-sedoheptulose 7-phosphate isomerase